uniref:Uncharacterized protein n=1 Tax=viral metagenome TaxID=1070528 RepID=A0A6C0BF39_9ZZZZ
MDSKPQIANALAQLERAQLGGRRKSTKKPAAGKKSGGAIMDDIKNLAVPFAILLAKEGLQSMFDDKKDKIGVASDSPKSTSAKSTSAKSTSARSTSARSTSASKKTSPKKQDGGNCASCQQPQMGGNNKKRNESMKQNYALLAKRIDEFLAKY